MVGGVLVRLIVNQHVVPPLHWEARVDPTEHVVVQVELLGHMTLRRLIIRYIVSHVLRVGVDLLLVGRSSERS